MSTSTISACQNISLGPNSKKGSSPEMKPGSSAPKSISDLTPPTKISSPLPSPNKSWHQSYSSFQTSTRSQCPRMHYHPWCDDCQTLTTWEQPLPIKPTYKTSIPTFGDLKTAIQVRSRYWSPSKNPSVSQIALQKV